LKDEGEMPKTGRSIRHISFSSSSASMLLEYIFQPDISTSAFLHHLQVCYLNTSSNLISAFFTQISGRK